MFPIACWYFHCSRNSQNTCLHSLSPIPLLVFSLDFTSSGFCPHYLIAAALAEVIKDFMLLNSVVNSQSIVLNQSEISNTVDHSPLPFPWYILIRTAHSLGFPPLDASIQSPLLVPFLPNPWVGVPPSSVYSCFLFVPTLPGWAHWFKYHLCSQDSQMLSVAQTTFLNSKIHFKLTSQHLHFFFSDTSIYNWIPSLHLKTTFLCSVCLLSWCGSVLPLLFSVKSSKHGLP